MHTPWPEDVGRIARQRRLDLGLSQDDLAERAHVTRQWISRFEQAKADVNLSKVMQVLRELDLTVDLAPRAAPAMSELPAPATELAKDLLQKTSMPVLSPTTLAAINTAVRLSVDSANLPGMAQAALRRLSIAGVPAVPVLTLPPASSHSHPQKPKRRSPTQNDDRKDEL